MKSKNGNRSGVASVEAKARFHQTAALPSGREAARKSGLTNTGRKKRDFSRRFRKVADALSALPLETPLDGEIVAREVRQDNWTDLDLPFGRCRV
jgi:hypothetical protein